MLRHSGEGRNPGGRSNGGTTKPLHRQHLLYFRNQIIQAEKTN